MRPTLKVVAPGTHTTVQDLGRFGYQNLGVPVSGALDSLSLRIANLLVGNPQGTPVLEILYQGPTLEVHAESVRVALTGSDAGLEIPGQGSGLTASWRSLCLRRGETLRIPTLEDSACAYLAVAGGFALEPCLGSVSTYVRGGIGGYRGRALQHGDALPLQVAEAPPRGERRMRLPPRRPGCPTLKVVLGPQRDYFTDAAVDALLESVYVVSAESDRMGMRLKGPRLEHRDNYNLISDALPLGAIQVPGSGQPILLLNDRQTTGGYPKIATVASADCWLAGRARPGDVMRFRAVSVEEAERSRREQEARLRVLENTALVPASPTPTGLDLEALYRENLVSGLWHGDDA
ncbi:MAG: biotin-dependent carboxyltransferase family protein [Gammaproteobacteria bacterium]|nr:biotin-dependent carboxyltransferase family protein [Gammaproteobacteria bacterium]NIR84377.1 biotin-dependent carboxyltransferase family protein [Gammaproteobacteria bacterium]NIR90858.1 biotin-dependent carboxyltransferase family protein [Gammaproteobacteria bacterium]NIU07044.1 biotin-dependent carboxyltransferase family protein [Gammaproteobacteria bacterium]NIV76173.1 5-oxoprolinase/urea amidolyase family protein [Gammaproteobacteria bacterium]